MNYLHEKFLFQLVYSLLVVLAQFHRTHVCRLRIDFGLSFGILKLVRIAAHTYISRHYIRCGACR